MFVIDRFEEAWAIVESDEKSFFKLPRSLLPLTVREGDSIEIIVKQDNLAAENRKARASNLLENFFEE